MLGFLNTLCGPNASNLKVKDMDKYTFDPTRLVLQISSILVRVWIQDAAHNADSVASQGFVGCLATHPDFSEATMTKCATVLRMSSMGKAELTKFANLLEKVPFNVFDDTRYEV